MNMQNQGFSKRNIKKTIVIAQPPPKIPLTPPPNPTKSTPPPPKKPPIQNSVYQHEISEFEKRNI